MVESLKELNQICQKPRYHEVGNWMVRHFLRDTALPITWLLLHTPITANQVTAASLVLGVAGMILFSFSSPLSFLTGTLLLQTWYLLDHVDGQIARYRKTACLSGRFFDFMTHHVIHSVVLFSLGAYGARATGETLFLVLGFIGSLAMTLFNLTHDTRHKTFYEALKAGGSFKVVEPPETGKSAENKQEGRSGLRRLLSVLHKGCEIHVLMNLLTLCAFLQVFVTRDIDYRLILFWGYSLVVPFLAAAKIFYLISNRKIDQEFEETFQRVEA